MKKILVTILVCIMLVSTAAAETIDFTSMSTDELIDLYQEIQLELADRIGLGSSTRIGRGSYVVGKDIVAGYYDFVCLDTDFFNFEGGGPDNDIRIYRLTDGDPSQKGDVIFWEQWFAIGAHVTFNLTEGTLLSIDGCSGELFAVSPAWVPQAN